MRINSTRQTLAVLPVVFTDADFQQSRLQFTRQAQTSGTVLGLFSESIEFHQIDETMDSLKGQRPHACYFGRDLWQHR